MNSRKVLPLMVGAAMAAAAIGSANAATPPASRVKSVILDAGNPGTTLSSGDTIIEQATAPCKTYPHCALSMRIMANVGQATCRNEWAIVGLVDGNSVDGGPLLEGLPAGGATQTQIWQGFYNMGVGNHTITFELYVPCPATAYQWSVRYLISTP